MENKLDALSATWCSVGILPHSSTGGNQAAITNQFVWLCQQFVRQTVLPREKGEANCHACCLNTDLQTGQLDVTNRG